MVTTDTTRTLKATCKSLHSVLCNWAQSFQTVLSYKCSIKLLDRKYRKYSQLSPCGHPAITDKIQIPGGSYRGLTKNDSRYDILSLLRNHGHFLRYRHNIFIVWALDNADTMDFSCNITAESLSLIESVLQYLQNKLQEIFLWLVFINQHTLLFHYSLHPFLQDSLGKIKPSSSILKHCLAF